MYKAHSWEIVLNFAAYGFNSSHSYCMALDSVNQAYLKAHYPKEYMSALMTSMQDDTDKIAFYTGECKRMGIRVLPPSVNESSESFAPTTDGIRFGLSAIKNIGGGFGTNGNSALTIYFYSYNDGQTILFHQEVRYE